MECKSDETVQTVSSSALSESAVCYSRMQQRKSNKASSRCLFMISILIEQAELLTLKATGTRSGQLQVGNTQGG